MHAERANHPRSAESNCQKRHSPLFIPNIHCWVQNKQLTKIAATNILHLAIQNAKSAKKSIRF
jgi:hypothetical protein